MYTLLWICYCLLFSHKLASGIRTHDSATNLEPILASLISYLILLFKFSMLSRCCVPTINEMKHKFVLKNQLQNYIPRRVKCTRTYTNFGTTFCVPRSFLIFKIICVPRTCLNFETKRAFKMLRLRFLIRQAVALAVYCVFNISR